MFRKYYKFLSIFLTLVFCVIFLPIATEAIEPDERLEYDIKKFAMTVGSATFIYKGDVEIEGETAIFMQVTAQGFQFYDRENIYLDSQTLLPLVVKRELDIFGKEETIIEKYDQKTGKVVISGRKQDQGEEESTVIKHEHTIDNIYGFIYRYRKQGAFVKNETISIQLPTKKVIMKFVGEETIKWQGEKIKTDYVEDVDKNIKIWFSQDEQRIPYKINGAIGFGKTSMVLKKDSKVNP